MPLRLQARFERNRRKAAALSARCGALARNDMYFGHLPNKPKLVFLYSTPYFGKWQHLHLPPAHAKIK